MGTGLSKGRLTVALVGTLLGALLTAASASASFHFIKIREVYPGTAIASHNDAFIELQAYASGQNSLQGHHMRVYNATGTPVLDDPIDTPPSSVNGDSQRTFVYGDSGASGVNEFSASLDLALGALAAGGAVCWENVDCVSWGNFNNTSGTPLPSPTGTPVLPTGIPDGKSITRSIAPNCSTLLEAADDTNDSGSDFALTAPTPRSNATVPTEKPCTTGGGGGGSADRTAPETGIDKGPKKKVKTRKKKAKVEFEFSSADTSATFECALDDAEFEACTSPFKAKVKKGKHGFAVRATDAAGNVDQSPAEQSFKVKRKKKK